jgi:hypothetical protein
MGSDKLGVLDCVLADSVTVIVRDQVMLLVVDGDCVAVLVGGCVGEVVTVTEAVRVWLCVVEGVLADSVAVRDKLVETVRVTVMVAVAVGAGVTVLVCEALRVVDNVGVLSDSVGVPPERVSVTVRVPLVENVGVGDRVADGEAVADTDRVRDGDDENVLV